MLQHASHVACEMNKRRRVRGAGLDQELVNALQEPGPGGADDELSAAVARLFKDAGVPYSRTNGRGEEYNLVDASIDEFVRWFDMPWE